MLESSRLKLYSLSVRNRIGRAFGAPRAYTPAQRATALAMWRVFRTRYDASSAAALLGCVDGECAFLVMARGDGGKAGGAFQWHALRRDMILRNTGIDVWAVDAAKQAEAALAEMSEGWSWYRYVGKVFSSATEMRDKMRVLVSKYEQSSLQDRDVDRRTPMAEYWLAQNLDAAEATS